MRFDHYFVRPWSRVSPINRTFVFSVLDSSLGPYINVSRRSLSESWLRSGGLRLSRVLEVCGTSGTSSSGLDRSVRAGVLRRSSDSASGVSAPRHPAGGIFGFSHVRVYPTLRMCPYLRLCWSLGPAWDRGVRYPSSLLPSLLVWNAGMFFVPNVSHAGGCRLLARFSEIPRV